MDTVAQELGLARECERRLALCKPESGNRALYSEAARKHRDRAAALASGADFRWNEDGRFTAYGFVLQRTSDGVLLSRE